MRTKWNTKYTKEILAEAVRTSFSMREVLRKCGAPDLSGGTHFHISKRVRAFGIDISHFTARSHNLGKQSMTKKTAEDILVKRSDGSRNRAVQLVRALLDIGRPYKCFVCGLREWMHKKIVLEIEHKDGDFQNDTKENLDFICPNCHSQTPSFCRRKDAVAKVLNRIRTVERKPSDDGYWRTKDKPELRKVERPSVEELVSVLRSSNFVQAGKKYGVSDNAVRKWAKRYGVDLLKVRGRSKMAKRSV